MIIRKLFKFEAVHKVSQAKTLYGHSYIIECKIESADLNKAGMVIDFIELSKSFKELVDSFDHSIMIWDCDKLLFRKTMQKFNDRWILMPINTTAENIARVFLQYLSLFLFNRSFKGIAHSVICHETNTGYAQAIQNDLKSKGQIGWFDINEIKYSKGITKHWKHLNPKDIRRSI